MRRVITLIVVIMLAGLMILPGCGKTKEAEVESILERETMKPAAQPEIEEPAEVEKPEPEKEPIQSKIISPEPVDAGPRRYALQLFSLTDRATVELHQELMSKKGIKTVISEFDKAGTRYYRLRMDGLYTKGEAEKLGDKLKKDFWSVNDYWVVWSK
jgi:cell division protein FtsN